MQETESGQESQVVTDARGRKRRRSDVWKHFYESIKEDGDKVVLCKYCLATYRNPQGTSNLWHHYKKRHRSVSEHQTTLTNKG